MSVFGNLARCFFGVSGEQDRADAGGPLNGHVFGQDVWSDVDVLLQLTAEVVKPLMSAQMALFSIKRNLQMLHEGNVDEGDGLSRFQDSPLDHAVARAFGVSGKEAFVKKKDQWREVVRQAEGLERGHYVAASDSVFRPESTARSEATLLAVQCVLLAHHFAAQERSLQTGHGAARYEEALSLVIERCLSEASYSSDYTLDKARGVLEEAVENVVVLTGDKPRGDLEKGPGFARP